MDDQPILWIQKHTVQELEFRHQWQIIDYRAVFFNQQCLLDFEKSHHAHRFKKTTNNLFLLVVLDI